MKRAMADKVKAAEKKERNSGGGARDFGLGDGKKEKTRGQMEREAYLAKKAEEEKVAKDALKARQDEIVRKGQAAAAAKALGSKKEKTVSDLSADDNPKVVSKVVGKALAIPKAENLLPKDVLPLALKKMPNVTIPDGTLPKDALLLIAAALAEVKAAKAAKEAAKRAAKKAEAQAKQDLIDVAAAKKKAEAAAAREAREAALAAAREGEEPEPEGAQQAKKDRTAKKKEEAETKKAEKKADALAKKNAAVVYDEVIGPDGRPASATQAMLAHNRAVTGSLVSKPSDPSIKIDKYSMSFAGTSLIAETTLDLIQGCRYGVVGDNGCGKSNFINSIALREVPIPDHVDMYHLDREADPTDRSAVEQVVDHVNEEVKKLEALSQSIMESSDKLRTTIWSGVVEVRFKCELDPDGFEVKARKVLSGLGFHDTMTVPMERKTKHMSGGWRMRVSLAKALFAAPTILLLDEPTNHLDLEACVWLEEYLKDYSKCLIAVSHSQDFLNAVCNRIIWIMADSQIMKRYSGNYQRFVEITDADSTVQMRAYDKQQMDISKLDDFIRKNSANKATYKSAQSKQKVLDKIMSELVAKPSTHGTSFKFKFPDCERLPPPVMPLSDVSFAYSGDLKEGTVLFRNLDVGVDCDSRIALVGANGSGKSTLLKLMAGELQPTEGSINRRNGLVLGRYHQHSAEMLDMSLSAFDFFRQEFPPSKLAPLGQYPEGMTDEEWRSFIGRYGLSGDLQMTQMGKLSDGQKARLIYAVVTLSRPNVLLLDEPTNHLDVGAIDSLAGVIKSFTGGVVLVSHDFRLIDQVADVIWECTGPQEGATIKVWPGSIEEYKKKLATKMEVFL